MDALRTDMHTVPLTPCHLLLGRYLFEVGRAIPGAKHVTIDDISGTESELNFIRYLLYSLVLKKMIVKPFANVIPELIRALTRFKRASGEVDVILKVPS